MNIIKTTTPLIANATFVASNVSTDNILENKAGLPSTYRGYVFSDQTFTVTIGQSHDDIHFDAITSITPTSVTGGYLATFNQDRYGRTVQLTIKNGATPMTTLRGFLGA